MMTKRFAGPLVVVLSQLLLFPGKANATVCSAACSEKIKTCKMQFARNENLGKPRRRQDPKNIMIQQNAREVNKISVLSPAIEPEVRLTFADVSCSVDAVCPNEVGCIFGEQHGLGVLEKPTQPTLCTPANKGSCWCANLGDNGFAAPGEATTKTWWKGNRQKCATVYKPAGTAGGAASAWPTFLYSDCYQKKAKNLKKLPPPKSMKAPERFKYAVTMLNEICKLVLGNGGPAQAF